MELQVRRYWLILTGLSVLLSLMIIVVRKEDVAASYVSVWHSHAQISSPATICLVFLTYNGLVNPSIWSRWYEDARIQMSNLGFDQLSETAQSDLLNCNAPPSPYLRAVLSWAPASATIETVKANTPCWMHDSIMPNPLQGNWGSTNHVMHAALRYARERHPDADLYTFVSDSSVPVKPFHQWHAEVTYDRRSRFYLWLMDFKDGLPKHAQWFALSRKHLDILVDHPDEWLGKGSRRADPGRYDQGVASEEEYYPLKVIVDHEFLEVPISAEDRVQTDWLEPILKPYVQNTPDLASFHWVHWYEIDRASREQFLGVASTHSNRPYRFETINAGLLMYLHEREGVWMMRKVSNDTVVEHCDMTHMDYVTHWLRINHGDGFPYRVSPQERLALQGNPFERLAAKCNITHFLTKTMHLKSSQPDSDYTPQKGEIQLYYGDRPLPKR